MAAVQTLQEFRELLQAGFENNEKTLEQFDKIDSAQLKAYLIESNLDLKAAGAPVGNWQRLEDTDWYVSKGGGHFNSLFLDKSRSRVWVIYSLIDADTTKSLINNWIKKKNGLDKVWLSRPQLLHLANIGEGWVERGLGIKFADGLATDEDSAGNVSVKAWHGANSKTQDIYDIADHAKKRFAISSVRWQKRTNRAVSITTEWYSDGRVTINRAMDVDEVLIWISEMANRYEDSLHEATILRNSTMAPFELNFTQEIDLESFSNTVSKGKGDMNLWLVETEHETDFRRFKGVDLHTWDRILLDVGLDYAYLTIPGEGCVNSAPRLAVVQGEDNAGVTSIYHDGTEVFV